MKNTIKINPDISSKITGKRNKAINEVLADMDRKHPNALFNLAKDSIDLLRGLLHSRLADPSGRYDDDIAKERDRLMLILRKTGIIDFDKKPDDFLIHNSWSVRTVENCKNIIDFINEACNFEEVSLSGPAACGFGSIMDEVSEALEYAMDQVRDESL